MKSLFLSTFIQFLLLDGDSKEAYYVPSDTLWKAWIKCRCPVFVVALECKQNKISVSLFKTRFSLLYFVVYRYLEGMKVVVVYQSFAKQNWFPIFQGEKCVFNISHVLRIYKIFHRKTALVKVFVAVWILITFHSISAMSLLHMSPHFNAVLLGFKSQIPFAVKCTFFDI